MFGIIFPGKSYPLDVSSFVQVDDHRWLLDVTAYAGGEYHQIKEVCVFLLPAPPLLAGRALALYVQAPGKSFEYRGAVVPTAPSAVLPLLWSQPGTPPPVPFREASPSNPGSMASTSATANQAIIGLSVEDASTLPFQNIGMQRRVEEMALKVGEHLLHFIQSFEGSSPSPLPSTNQMTVPANVLDLWFQRFQEKARLDPDFINRFTP